MQTIYNIKQNIKSALSDIYDKREIQSFIYIIFEHVLNYSKIDTVLNKKEEIEDETCEIIYSIIKRLEKEEPIQYILGETEFYDLIFNVNESTLIPRGETEELVQLVINENIDRDISILDIGTGSGCIAISLAKNLERAKVSALDISEKAIETAKENAEKNNVKVNFFLEDILNIKQKYENYDIIVSNPPYICNSEKKLMQNNVLDYEPHTALFVEDNDPLIFYRTIAIFALDTLKEEGLLYFEINEALAKEMKEMLEEYSYKNIEIIKDINERNRIVKAQK
ncbi:MAG: peptide chain release factor N(5)-glutamine methyltransferase [Marinifilaceae bacterium]